MEGKDQNLACSMKLHMAEMGLGLVLPDSKPQFLHVGTIGILEYMILHCGELCIVGYSAVPPTFTQWMPLISLPVAPDVAKCSPRWEGAGEKPLVVENQALTMPLTSSHGTVPR